MYGKLFQLGTLRITMDNQYEDFFHQISSSEVSETAFCDYLTRKFHHIAKQHSRNRGAGNNGLITIDEQGPAILQRNYVLMERHSLEVRFFVGLPTWIVRNLWRN
jgi:hypothetical protein